MPVTEIATVAEAVAHLSMPGTPADGGAKLQTYIDACTVVVEDIVGHVLQTQIVGEVYDGGDTAIYLRHCPVISVDTIVEVIGLTSYTLTSQPVGASVDNFGYSLDMPDEGLVLRRSAAGTPFPFFGNTGNITVTYTVGRASVPANVKLGLLELLRLAWQHGQQGNRAPFGAISGAAGDEASSVTPSGYLVPNRVKELLQPNLGLPVFA